MTTILQSTRDYETWLKTQLGSDLVVSDLDRKHAKMKSGGFSFLRATYWRWAETILDLCPNLGSAPPVLAIGDTHLENFGTWRDIEGRLVWGANDFDDAAVMPYALDLVRLTASAVLARSDDALSSTDISEAILGGYRRGLISPAPIILERDHKWLRNAVMLPNAERKDFWEKYRDLPIAAKPVPDRFMTALRDSLPDPAMPFSAQCRTAGTGSLGRPRFVALIEWRGGPVLREAKALLQSGWSLRHDPGNGEIRAGAIADGRARSPDPQYRVVNGVLVRRLSPNSRKIEVKTDPSVLLSPDMLDLMGFEIANCHSSDAARIPVILHDLQQRDGDWLRSAAKAAVAGIAAEQRQFAANWS